VITAALVILAVAAGLFLVRLFRGPHVPDRAIALDGLLVTVVCGILVASARSESSVSLDTALLVSLVSFVGTGVLARYIEKRGG
jgi:multisubunit Na+/H+ antiporter MnhF subunit